MIRGLLVVIPCGKRKIWDKDPLVGPTRASESYAGSPFIVNKNYAMHFGEAWVILSAKYGFISPDFEVPGPYNVTFKRKKTSPVSVAELRKQVHSLNLVRFPNVVGLGGKEYRFALEQAFDGENVTLHFPFAGLGNGPTMQAANRAIESDDPFGKKATKCGMIRKVTRTPSSSSESDAFATLDGRTDDGGICSRLHRWLEKLPVFEFPFSVEDIPKNGVYILFEQGEEAHGTRRVVRVGTHTGDNQLRSRLTQHFAKEKKDRSIFRKNIGRCLLTRDQDSFLESWERDLTTKAAKAAYSPSIDFEKQQQVEKRVSERIQKRFSFSVIDVQDKDVRLQLERKLISTVSLCPFCGPSDVWLGLHSPKRKIRESGLWQVNELYKTGLTSDELERLQSPA